MTIDFAHRILNSLNNGIIIVDKDLEILFWNTWLELHTQYVPQEAVGKTLLELFPALKVSSLKRKIKTALALNSPAFYSAQTSQALFTIQRPHISNTIFHEMKQDITISPYNLDLGLVCINIVDQTQLFEANYKLSASANFKSNFLASMSHEIRTPMNAILGFVEQLSKSETKESRIAQFAIIKRSGNSLLAIINDILDLSKIESGGFELNYSSCDIRHIFKEISLLYTDLAQQKNISLDCTLSPELPKYLVIDTIRTKQIIFNLLSNAIKFTPEKGNVFLDVEFNPHKKELIIKVKDTGIGIAEENIDKIFNAFKQETPSTSEHYGGTGLGLSISSKLVKLMKGNISASSMPAKGSTFTVTIPASISEELTIDCKDSIKKEKVLQTKGLKALMVEDNKTNQILLSIILEEFSLSFDIANDGLEALEMFENNTYDIILMDENMPNMNGNEAAKKMRQREIEKNAPKTPIIAITANALPKDKDRLQKAGMDDVIAKPYTEQAIKDILIKYLP
ncbi:response regulator [Sulfurimonas sp. MAG313]|nr:ATP-binding protein [Sulfurimonas sp. MAG313]MDF1880709.1 response regulator [Sulfurimonas sp. MAG313]